MFYFCKIGNLEVLKSDKLNIAHFFTTRNSILKTKDPAFMQAAEENKAFFKNYYNLKRLISPSQTHTSNVRLVDDNDIYEDTDALILDKKDIGIFLNFADCVPVIMYDTKNNAASIIHAGWRGTKEQIVKKAFYKLNSRYNSNPDNIVALIGPSICKKCFETSKDIALMLSASVSDNGGCTDYIEGKYYADLKEINKRQMIDLGIKNIDTAQYCTCCNNDKFFSYRKENKTTNRISAFLTLN